MTCRNYQNGQELNLAGLNGVAVLVGRNETQLTQVGWNRWHKRLEGLPHSHETKEQIPHITDGEGPVLVGPARYAVKPRRVVLQTMLALCCGFQPALAENQTFNSSTSAAAGGWTGLKNTVGGNDFALQSGNIAGDATGEASGTLKRVTLANARWSETTYHENGQKEHEATWVNGRLLAQDGTRRCNWTHDPANNTSTWVRYWGNWRKRVESTWNTQPVERDLPTRNFRGRVAHGPAYRWNSDGTGRAGYSFANGSLNGTPQPPSPQP